MEKTKENRVQPTEKQKLAFKELVENGSTKKEAMIRAGYSPNTAKAPTKMTNSKGWQQLIEEYLPDADLAKVHREGLNAIKSDKFTLKIGGEEKLEVLETPDYAVRHKYLDTAYKIKGKLVDRVDINIGRKSTEKLQDEELNRVMNIFNDNPRENTETEGTD